MEESKRKQIREVLKYVDDYYVTTLDITLIIVDYIDIETNEVLVREISGFYPGEPNWDNKLDNLKRFDGKPRTVFNEAEFKVVKTVYDEGPWKFEHED